MNVIFRVDASVAIGTGHVVRCLTLAAALSKRGATVLFLCRDQEGNMIDLLAERGFRVAPLRGPARVSHSPQSPGTGNSPEVLGNEDVEQTMIALRDSGAKPDWLIVDNYALDAQWESALRDYVGHIMVIDDLADRMHDCDLLLDQNYSNPRHRQYPRLLPSSARQLLGTEYALIRAEFSQKRAEALGRRTGHVARLLISMGGTDPANDTANALLGLGMSRHSRVPVDVVVGAQNRHRHEIGGLCEQLANSALHVQTSQMAELMTRADLAVTAAGSTTWERCVLGLPGIVTIQSHDQVAIADSVARRGGHRVLGLSRDLAPEDYARALDELDPEILLEMSKVSAGLCDGLGAERVADVLVNWNE